MAFLEVVVGLEAGSDELGVVNQAVLVRVNDIHGVKELRFGQVDIIDLLHALLELLESERAVTVFIHLGEGDTETLDLILGDARSDQGKSRTLQLQRVHVRLNVCEDIW